MGGMLALAPQAAWAQSGRKPQGRIEKPIVRLETLEVVLPLLAYDANGRFVDDLKPQEVLVLEEKEARPVASLKREPANIILILDGSNEIGTFKNGPTQRYHKDDRPIWEKGKPGGQIVNPTSREFALKFLAGLSPRDQVAIIQYADRVQVLQDWTSDPAQAAKSLQSKYRVGIKSTYHDALKLAAEKLEQKKEGRRIVVMLTDGIDTAGKTGKSKAMVALEKARATVFAIGWGEAVKREVELAIGWMRGHENFTSASASRLGEMREYLARLDGASIELQQLAESSGGIAWMPATHEEVIAASRPLTAEIGAQYSLTFVTERKPSLEDNRSIQVLPARPGLSLRSRRTYYAGEEAHEDVK